MPTCPTCEISGKPVKRVTLDNLLTENHRSQICDTPYFVCTTPGCAIVYFTHNGHSFNENTLRVPFGLKGNSNPTTVCYCFTHAAEDIHEELARTGQTGILDQIKMEMKETGCRCESENPLGTCCLDTVRDIIREAIPSQSASSVSLRSKGWLATAGSVFVAALSSACCWLPLLLVAMGVSSVGVIHYLESWRIPLLFGSAILLTMGFYFAYSKRASCCEGSSDSRKNNMQRMNRVTLWIATTFVLMFALFPNYVGKLFGSSTLTAATADENSEFQRLVFSVDGMTCDGCAVTLREALTTVEGVKEVAVSYEKMRAIVLANTQDADIREKLKQRIRDAGYHTNSTNIKETDNP